MQICLTTSDSITLELAGAVTTDQPEFIASYIDTADDTPGSTKGELNDTTPVTAAAAPTSGNRLVYRIDVCNVDTAGVVVVVKIAGGTGRTVIRKSLSANESVNLLDMVQVDGHTHILADVTDSGTIASQDADSVAITGGAIDGTAIGGTTPAAGSFTTADATSYAVGGTAGANFSGAVTNITVVNGIVTAVS